MISATTNSSYETIQFTSPDQTETCDAAAVVRLWFESLPCNLVVGGPVCIKSRQCGWRIGLRNWNLWFVRDALG